MSTSLSIQQLRSDFATVLEQKQIIHSFHRVALT